MCCRFTQSQAFESTHTVKLFSQYEICSSGDNKAEQLNENKLVRLRSDARLYELYMFKGPSSKVSRGFISRARLCVGVERHGR